jgi:hypothetical protein
LVLFRRQDLAVKGGSVPLSDKVMVDIRGLNAIEGINES